MRLFKIKTTGWQCEDFLVATSLDEKQVRSVIQPLVEDEHDNEILYSNADYVEALRTRYPKAIVIPEGDEENLEFSPNQN